MGLKRITTLITPAETYDLVTLEAVKVELEIPDSDTSKDAWLAGVITQVSGAIERYCNRSPRDVNEGTFPVEQVSELFYPERDAYPYQVPGGTDPLQLSRFPIADAGVTSVTIVDPPGTTQTLVEGTDFVVNPAFGQLVRLDPYMQYPTIWWPIPTTVVYSGGYDEIPDDVQAAALRWITQRFGDRKREPNLLSFEEAGVGTKRYWVGDPKTSGGLPEEIAELLDAYRTPTVA